MHISCSDGLILFENLPYEAQNLDNAGPESLRQLDVEVAVIIVMIVIICRFVVQAAKTLKLRSLKAIGR